MEDNCICSEWDGKGWSTCGYPCPEHITNRKIRKQIVSIEKFLAQDHDEGDPFTKEIVAMSGRQLVMLNKMLAEAPHEEPQQ